MAKAGFSRTTMAEMEYWMMKCCTEVREERMRGVEFPGHRIVKAMIERHLAMVHQNQMDGCLPCQNGMAKYTQTRWRSKKMGALTPFRCRQPTPEPMPPAPGKPPAPPGDNAEAPSSQIKAVLPRYVHIHTPLPKAQFFNLGTDAKYSKPDADYIPDLVSDE